MTTTTTADGVELTLGSAAYNYYDMKPGLIERFDDYAQPNTMRGQNCDTPVAQWTNYWFTFRHTDGSSALLDGSRICTLQRAKARGWLTTDQG